MKRSSKKVAIFLLGIIVSISCKTTQLPNTHTRTLQQQYNDCVDLSNECMDILKDTTDQLEQTNKMLNNYDGIKRKQKLTWTMLGFGIGTATALTLTLSILLSK